MWERPQCRDRRDAKVPPTFHKKKEAPGGLTPPGADFSGGELSPALLHCDSELDAAVLKSDLERVAVTRVQIATVHV